MSSTRLPGKILLDIAGEPMLVRVVERLRQVQSLDQILVATTSDRPDDATEALCKERGYACFRGSTHDVLDRYYQAARQHRADIVVRITADCPLIDPGLIDEAVATFTGSEGSESRAVRRDARLATAASPLASPLSPFPYDFVANRLPPPWGRTYPVGLDIEVCSFSGLEQAWSEADQPHQREHVMPFFYEQPERFRIRLLNHKFDYGELRWTVDTPQDLELLRSIAAHFDGRDDFTWLEVLEFVKDNPGVAQINAFVQPKDYRDFDARNRDGG